MTHVSVVMLACNRPKHLWNTLRSWANVEYSSFDFHLIDNGSSRPEENMLVAKDFVDKLNLTFYRESKWRNMSILWNKYGQTSKGDYVVFAMQDEIVCGKDVLQKMMAFENNRASIFTYFLSKTQTAALDEISWRGNPFNIPLPFTDQASAGLISHINGNWRKNWDWFGWFRGEERGHLWLDQDVHLREVALGNYTETPRDVYCLHQYHDIVSPVANFCQPGYRYVNEKQARLLEPAKRDDA